MPVEISFVFETCDMYFSKATKRSTRDLKHSNHYDNEYDLKSSIVLEVHYAYCWIKIKSLNRIRNQTRGPSRFLTPSRTRIFTPALWTEVYLLESFSTRWCEIPAGLSCCVRHVLQVFFGPPLSHAESLAQDVIKSKPSVSDTLHRFMLWCRAG